MNPAVRIQILWLSAMVALGLTVLLVGGCRNREEAAEPPPPGAAESPAPSTVVAPSARREYDARAAAAAEEQLRQAQAAQQARDYEKAVEAMLQLEAQRRVWNQQQAAQYQQQMQRLQADLAAAVASGDPRAKAAADRLRRAATVR